MKLKPKTVEEKFPNAQARRAADEAIDELSNDEPMSKYLSTWVDTYYRIARTLPPGQRS